MAEYVTALRDLYLEADNNGGVAVAPKSASDGDLNPELAIEKNTRIKIEKELFADGTTEQGERGVGSGFPIRSARCL